MFSVCLEAYGHNTLSTKQKNAEYEYMQKCNTVQPVEQTGTFSSSPTKLGRQRNSKLGLPK